MQKSFFLILFLSLLISACGSAVPEPPAPTATEPVILLPTPGPTEPPCSTVSAAPTPGLDTASLFSPVSAEDHIRGPLDAIVTLIVYNDFQCEECNYLPLAQKLRETHPEDLRVVYRYYPYEAYYDKGELAARAAEAAGKQGKFWEMHDLLFERQADWVQLSPEAFQGWIGSRAAELELDPARFEADLDSTETIERVRNAAQEASRAGIPVLPLFVINSQVYTGQTNFSSMNRIVELIALGKRQFAECPALTIDPDKQYIATLRTEKGEVLIQLFPDRAPLAVNSFVFLARNGWFDDITFHRVLPGVLAQTGDPSGTGGGNPGYLFKNEIALSLEFDQPGMVGMANPGPDANGSQFFITYAPLPSLNGAYTIFGKVISGMDVLEGLTPRNPDEDPDLPPGDRLISVSIQEK